MVVLDRRMPGPDGEAVLERVRERDLSCRVAMVTGVELDVDATTRVYFLTRQIR